jgi:hypothetical protein
VEYLGIKISRDGKVKEKVKHQINKTNRVVKCLNNTIWKNKHLSVDTKSKIYKSVVRTITTYTAETRPETTMTQRILKTAEMEALRKITN